MAVLVSPAAAPRALRRRLAGLAVLAAVAGGGGPALAQLDDYGGGYARYGYGYDYDDGYRYGRRYDYAPLSPAPRTVARIAAQELGLREVQRTVRTGSAIVVDGVAADRSRVRIIIDRFGGGLIDRIVLQPPPRTARLDPREEERPAPKKLTPRPPERPAGLKPARPPAEAAAPATVIPPSPAAPKPDAAPARPAAAPAVAPKDIGKPKLVNPQDVRGADEPDRLPPLARAHPSGIPVPDTTVPPVTVVP